MPSAPASSEAPRVALITGATGGIGRATAIALASEGYTLALHYHEADGLTRNSLLQAVSVAQKAADPDSVATAVLFQADMSLTREVSALYAAVTSRLGAPLVIYLNAGTTAGSSGMGDIADVSLHAFEAAWRVNTFAPFQLAQLSLPAMQSARWGRVIFCSSVAGLTGGVVGPHYASSKSALHGIVHWLAPRVAAQGITVNAIAPALIESTAMLPSSSPDLVAKIPIGRLGRPDEIADTVVWMVRNAYVTNKVFAVDGGIAIQ